MRVIFEPDRGQRVPIRLWARTVAPETIRQLQRQRANPTWSSTSPRWLTRTLRRESPSEPSLRPSTRSSRALSAAISDAACPPSRLLPTLARSTATRSPAWFMRGAGDPRGRCDTSRTRGGGARRYSGYAPVEASAARATAANPVLRCALPMAPMRNAFARATRQRGSSSSSPPEQRHRGHLDGYADEQMGFRLLDDDHVRGERPLLGAQPSR